MKFGIGLISNGIGFVMAILFLFSHAFADSSETLTLIYSGEEQGQLGLHGCGAEQVGGLSRRQTIIQSLREKQANILNLHTGNILSSTDSEVEIIYQIALEALEEMDYDAIFLGPQDLCLPVDSLQALCANHPNLPVVCTNLSVSSSITSSFAPYIVQNTPSQIKVAFVGLISKPYETEVTTYNPGITLSPPEEALDALGGEIAEKSDVVVGVFHGTEVEARGLAEQFAWLDVLVLAGNKFAETSSDAPSMVRNTMIMTNPPKGEAVGVLEIGLDANLSVVSRLVYRVEVSERIAPDENLESLLALYHSLSEDSDFDGNDGIPTDHAIRITYFHKRGCQKCARASDMWNSVSLLVIIAHQTVAKRCGAPTKAASLLGGALSTNLPSGEAIRHENRQTQDCLHFQSRVLGSYLRVLSEHLPAAQY